ncbi:unnamed protein product [Sphenostylis stenocarpa]|uniref:Uncharacterized protein n=1 Tax=Sphenostylis stenocarpa TaxID=92480 RepID=A0AA86VQM5_9FABA|nr:unnamed protein product [Sphenostylis stenocarpa]
MAVFTTTKREIEGPYIELQERVSGGTKIATGLEQSKQKFIWVLRDADKGEILDESEAKEHELPNRFDERVKGIGHPNWKF